MNENIKVEMNASIKKQHSIATSIALFSQDIDNYSFDIAFTDLELQAGDEVEVLAKLQGGKLEHKSSANLVEVDGELIARYVFDTKLIDSEGHVFCYVYLKRGDKSADVGAFYFEVDLSKLDKVGGKIAEVYDGRYEDLVAGFEIKLQGYRDSLPQASEVRAEVDEVITQFGVDSQKAIGDLGEVSATVEIAEASRVEKESERVQAETERKEAETLREENYEQLIDTALIEADVVEKVDNKVTELTPRMNELTAQLAQTDLNKVDKNGSGQVGWANIAQDARQQIIGNVPPAVVGTDAVTTTNLTNKAVTTNKRTTSGSGAFINTLGVPFNVDTVLNKISFPSNTYMNYQNKTTIVSPTAFEIPLANGVLLYNTDTNTLKCALPTNVENELILGVTYKTGLSFNGYYTVDGLEQNTNYNHVFGYMVHASTPLNINTTTDTLTLPPGNKYILYGKKIITLPLTEVVIPLKTGGFLYYDTIKSTFNVGVPDSLLTTQSIMLGYIASRSFNEHYINSRYTVDGKQNIKANTITKEMLDFDPLTEIPTLTIESKWAGKTGVVFGDSITNYDQIPFGATHSESGQTAVGYPTYMRNQLQCTVVKKGAPGEAVTGVRNQIRAYDFSNTDFVTITSGANDMRTGLPIGEIKPIGSSFDLTTFHGLLQDAIESILTRKKTIKIYLMTPIRGWYNEYNTANVPNTDPKIVGMMNEDIPNAIKAIGKLYGLPVLDWYNLTGLNEMNKNTYLGDGLSLPYYLHPTNTFYERMASSLIPFLNNY